MADQAHLEILSRLSILQAEVRRDLADGVPGLPGVEAALLQMAAALDTCLEELLEDPDLAEMVPEIVGQMVIQALICQGQRTGAEGLPKLNDMLRKGVFDPRLRVVVMPGGVPG